MKWRLIRSSLAGPKLVAAIALSGMAPLRAYAEEAPVAALASVTVNGEQLADPELVFEFAQDDMCIPIEAMARLRISTNGMLIRLVEGERCAVLNVASGIAARFEPARQALALDVPPERLPVARVEAERRDLTPLAKSAVGGFLNYDLAVRHVEGETSVGTAVTAGLFAPGGHGDTSAVAQLGGVSRLTRLETRWTIDQPGRMRSWRFGDTIGAGATGVPPFRFAGIQLARNFDAQPGFLTLPLSAIGGSATLPSVAELYVNNVLQSRFDVRPGPFTVSDVPLVSGEGEVRLVVHDLLGRETVVSERFYAAPQLLRRGLAAYSYEAGFLRRDFGAKSFSYGEPFAAMTQRYGISDQLTGEFHVAASPQVQQAGVAASVAWPGIGMVTASAAANRSGQNIGARVQLGLERRSPRLSYGVVSEWANDFVTLGSVAQGTGQAARVRAYVGRSTSFGSLGLSYTTTFASIRPDFYIATASAAIRLGRFATLNLLASFVGGTRDEAALRAVLAVPLGRSSSATLRARADSGGAEVGVGYRRQAQPARGWGFGFDANAGPSPAVQAHAELHSHVAAFSGELSLMSGAAAIRVGATGSLGLIAGTPFAARRLGSSFGVIDLGGLANVRIFADNVLIGRSAPSGRMIVPELRPFQLNSIRIDAADVPLDTELVSDRVTVRPPEGSGLIIKLAKQEEGGASLRARLEDGSPLPTGTAVTVPPANRTSQSPPGGQVHVPLRAGKNTITDGLGTRRCGFDLVVPTSGTLVPVVETSACWGNDR